MKSLKNYFEFDRIPTPVWIILFISLVIRVIIAASLGPSFDEAYYFSYSLRPSLSYFDHPPMVALIAGFFPSITGIITPLTLRLTATLLFTFGSLLLYFLALQVMQWNAAVVTFAFVHLSPMMSLGAGTLVLPDSGLFFFWVLAARFLFKILIKNEKRAPLWIAAGVCSGLAMLSKYTGILLGISLLLYLILYKRDLFLSPGPYLYGFFALLIFSPVLIWNFQHDFISFTFQGSRGIGKGIRPDLFFSAIAGQALYLTPIVFLPMLIVIWQTFKKGIFESELTYRIFFFWGTVPVLIVNFIALFKSILPHWTLPGYILLMLPLGRWYSESMGKYRWLPAVSRASIAFILLVTIIVFSHAKFGILREDLWAKKGWITEKQAQKDPTLDLHGWEEINTYLEREQIDREDTFLFTYRWFLSGEVEFATEGKYRVMCFHPKDSRGYGIWDAKLNMVGKNGIYICTNRYFYDPVEKYSEYFESISAPDSLVIKRGGRYAKTIYFYRCRNLLKRYPLPY